MREVASNKAHSHKKRRTQTDIAPLLRALYGERLAKLVLYGSFARGEAWTGSDIDVLVVLRGKVHDWTEIKRMSAVTQPIALEHEELIAKLPMSLEDYNTRRSPLLINVRRGGEEL